MSITIKKKTILDFIFLIFILYPSFRFIGFEMYYVGTATPSYIRIWSLLAFIVSVFLYITKVKYQKKDFPILLYCAYTFFLTLYTMTSGSEAAITSLLSFITSFIGTTYFIRSRVYKSIDLLFLFFSISFLVELVVLFTSLNKPFIQSNILTFIGHIQIYSMLWVTFITLGLIKLTYIKRKKNTINLKRTTVILMIIIGTIISCSFGVTIVKLVVLIFLCLFVFFRNKKINSYKVLIIFFIIAMLLNASFLFYNYQNTFLSFLQVIGDNATLNGRTYIWSLFMPLVSKSPIIGYGYKVQGVVLSNWGYTNSMDYCHNTLLQELINGGLIQLILFILIIFKSISNIEKCKNDRLHHIAFCCFISFFAIMITESITYYNYFNVIVVIMMNLDYISKLYEENLEEE